VVYSKGEFGGAEEPIVAAKEFQEETGQIEGQFVPLKPIQYKDGRKIVCWAVEGEIAANQSNLFPLEWPPKSGIDVPKWTGNWFTVESARQKYFRHWLPLMTLFKI
jgi:predicted NUDIX family NTP pyrophosphohydrolase